MANKKIPMRQCVGCHEMKAKGELIRVIRTASDETENEAEVMLDTTGRKNGRGAYLCPNGRCLEQAIKSRGLERSLKMSIPKEVYEMLTKEMRDLETR